jgi:hypothetical protein
VVEFIWIDWNLQKIENHNLSAEEVEFAWSNGRDVKKQTHPVNGVCWERIGECPSGRIIRIVWRWNEVDDGKKIFVITAY